MDIQQVREYLPDNIMEPGEVLHGRVSLSASGETHVVAVRWFDAFSRLAGVTEVTVVPPARGADFFIRLVDPLSYFNRLEVMVDGDCVTITEVGDVEHPGTNNASNLKNAASDALKRCAMRLGVGLHLWSQDNYYLDKALEKRRVVADE